MLGGSEAAASPGEALAVMGREGCGSWARVDSLGDEAAEAVREDGAAGVAAAAAALLEGDAGLGLTWGGGC